MTINAGDAQPGDLILFGAYPHTAAGTDRIPIQWRVLENTGRDLFLLSEYLIDSRRYHNTAVAITWQDCDLRRWLNTEFLNATFTPAEQARIKITRCTDNGEGSPATDDRVFLLSVAEIETFTIPGDGPHRRRTIATDYAKTKKLDGTYVYVYDKGIEQDYVIVDGVRRGCSWWLTRTQSQRHLGNFDRATFIGARSNIKRYGKVDQAGYGLRPAIRLDLSM